MRVATIVVNFMFDKNISQTAEGEVEEVNGDVCRGSMLYMQGSAGGQLNRQRVKLYVASATVGLFFAPVLTLGRRSR